MTKQPNVLFLTIDALRSDRTSFLGYQRPTTPSLDRIAGQSIVCTNTISNASFSQPSFASIFTSSLPLSYGGYDRGAEGRPRSIFQRFRDAGYYVNLLSPYPSVSRFQGYRGHADKDCALFVLNALPGLALTVMREPIGAFSRGQMSQEQLIHTISPIIIKLFEDLIDYCTERHRERNRERNEFAYSRMVNDGYDFQKIINLVHRHHRDFSADPWYYMQQHLIPFPGTNAWLPRIWRYTRKPNILLQEGFRRLQNRLLSRFDPKKSLLNEYRYKRYLDGADLADRVIGTLSSGKNDEKPVFLWTHFFDTHTPYCPGKKGEWAASAPDYLKALGYDGELDVSAGLKKRPASDADWKAWSALYDGAISYVDEQIGRIINYLEESNLADNTILVISGDHGEELGEHGDVGHHFRCYEHNIRVPVLIRAPGQTARTVDGPTSLLDLGPTMAHLAGIGPDAAWEGLPVTADIVTDRSHQINECFHSGSCLFDLRPLYIGIRTNRFKFFWKEYKDPTDHYSLDGHELYDLLEDPGELTNLYRPDHPELPKLNGYVAKRLSEISEISPERIAALFPDFAVDT